VLHSSHFDFNDRVLPRTMTFFTRLLEDRWGVELFSDSELPSFPGDDKTLPDPSWVSPPPSSSTTTRTEDVSGWFAASN
jgi:hypothetical protein